MFLNPRGSQAGTMLTRNCEDQMRSRKMLPSLVIFAMSIIATARAGLAQSSLRQESGKVGLLVGAAVNPAWFSQPEYAHTLAREFNMVEPENVMKWTTIEPELGRFNFVPGDAVVAFAEAHQMKVRGHNLLWGVHNPRWLVQGHFSPQELRRIMKTHITREARHYRGKVFAWDVVNEAFDSAGHLKHSIWYDRPGIGLAGNGTAYIAQAFRWAHAADPLALLFYNDYDAEGLNAKSNAIYAMVKDFKRRGVPINGVGLQMHLLNLNRIPSSVEANIARLGRLGVQAHITEMDVALPTGNGRPGAAELAKQAAIYRHMATACAEQPACTAFQTWGFTDKYSWIPGFTKGRLGAALLFDAHYKPKPAYWAVVHAFAKIAKEKPQIRSERLRLERRTPYQHPHENQ
jgi:endo-1,4-beta-xylanase